MAITKEKKQELVTTFGTNPKDSGRSQVQIAIMTERIEQLTGHLKKFPKDHSSRRGLLKLVGARRRLLKYLKREELTNYRELIQTLNLRK